MNRNLAKSDYPKPQIQIRTRTKKIGISIDYAKNYSKANQRTPYKYKTQKIAIKLSFIDNNNLIFMLCLQHKETSPIYRVITIKDSITS